jgi:hypothetical protein
VSIFDSLPKPADRNRQALRADLELRRERWAHLDYHYRGGADLVLRHGKFYTGRKLPDQYEWAVGAESECFANALRATMTDPSLTYCEGYFWSGQGHAITHGWCVAPDGGVVEVTLPTVDVDQYVHETLLPFLPVAGWAYWGVMFTTELALAYNEDGAGLPMLDRSAREIAHGARRAPHLDMRNDDDWPILTVPYDPQRKDMP